MPGGRPSKPNALKLLQGNPGQRRLNNAEPVLAVRMPDAPAWLDGKAQAAWRELASVLTEMRVVTDADKKALELLCDAYSEYRTARSAIREHGSSYKSATEGGGFIIRSRPEVAIASDAWRRVKSLLSEFGLTPSSRTKVKSAEPSTVDPFEVFLNGSGA